MNCPQSDLHPKTKNIQGRVFGYWTVVSFDCYRRPHNRSRWRGAYWTCICNCGTQRSVSATSLLEGNSKSCGCAQRLAIIQSNQKHGHASRKNGKTKTYRAWRSMLTRCYLKSSDNFQRYGGRGIKVCERWLKFHNFLSDMGECPNGLTLDRIDNEGDYTPNNCHWVTHVRQCRNRSTNHFVTFKGETPCIADWSDKIGISPKTLNSRINQYNWSIEKAITTPVRPYPTISCT